jgi:putative ABC transport system substrate-binding protein
MKRRDFITLFGGAAAGWPLAARAQQGDRMRRIGVLMNGVATDAPRQAELAVLAEGLRLLGWTEGQNVHIEVRFNAGDAGLARTYAAQLLGLLPDVILAASSTNLSVIQQATITVPVVFVQVSDPVAQGFVPNMTKPGGNITGFSNAEFSFGGKWLGLLKEIAPGLARVAVMFNPETSPQSKYYLPPIEAAASSLGVQTVAVQVGTTADIELALQSFASQPNGGLILTTDTFTRLRGQLITDLAIRHRLPMIDANIESARRGTLMYYGGADASLIVQWRQAAGYIDRILKGAKPGDLPVQNADKYTLLINLKTAKMLGLTVPNSLLAIADEVIE